MSKWLIFQSLKKLIVPVGYIISKSGFKSFYKFKSVLKVPSKKLLQLYEFCRRLYFMQSFSRSSYTGRKRRKKNSFLSNPFFLRMVRGIKPILYKRRSVISNPRYKYVCKYLLSYGFFKLIIHVRVWLKDIYVILYLVLSIAMVLTSHSVFEQFCTYNL